MSLTDHINFAIQRNQKGLDIKNALLWETKRLYKDEFAIGKEALVMVKTRLVCLCQRMKQALLLCIL